MVCFSKTTLATLVSTLLHFSNVAAWEINDGKVMLELQPDGIEDKSTVKINDVVVHSGESRNLAVDLEYSCPPGYGLYLLDVIPPAPGNSFFWSLSEGCGNTVIMSSTRLVGFWKKFCFPDGFPIIFVAMGTGSFSASVLHLGPLGASISADVEAEDTDMATIVEMTSVLVLPSLTVELEAIIAAMGNIGFAAQVTSQTDLPVDCDALGPFYFSSYGGGDPHFRTWGRHWFDFHGACDLVTVSSHDTTDHGLDLAIHTRTTARYDWSYIEAIAVKIGDDVLEVRSYGDHFLNGIQAVDLPATMADPEYLVTHEVRKQSSVHDRHVFKIELSQTEHIILESFKDLVAIKLANATYSHYGGSLGLMGEFGSGVMLGRDGVTEITDANAFGIEWQVRDTDDQLFVSSRHPQYPEGCVMPDVNARSARRLGEGHVSKEAAKAACLEARNDENLDACIYDVMATGDLEVALAGTF